MQVTVIVAIKSGPNQRTKGPALAKANPKIAKIINHKAATANRSLRRIMIKRTRRNKVPKELKMLLTKISRKSEKTYLKFCKAVMFKLGFGGTTKFSDRGKRFCR